MRSIALVTTLIGVSLSLSGGQASVNAPCPQGPHTLYSKRAVRFDGNRQTINSPDGRKALTINFASDQKDAEETYLVFSVHVGNKTFSERLLGFNAEALWSPDSSAFAVTQTEGGGGIGYRVYVFYVNETGLRKVVVSDVVEKAFGTPVKCEVSVPPNTGFVDWLGNRADRMLIAAEVVPVSICECSGTFKLYELTLPEVRVERTYSQTEAVNRFGNLLGCELRDANTGCGTNGQK